MLECRQVGKYIRPGTAVISARKTTPMFALLARPTQYLFFTGKGGVGKTSLACATAVTLADRGKGVLLVSTDPASNLDQVLDVSLSRSPAAIATVPGLFALNIDPEAAAEAYRARALGPLRGVISDEELRRHEEELSGACTVEIAAFDEFTGILTRDERLGRYDHIIFDTAPTGHTLRLLRLPAAWTDFIVANPAGASCLGPTSSLQQQREKYEQAVAALGDSAQTTVVLVTRPDRGAITEAARSAGELSRLGMKNQHLVVNGMFTATDRQDAVAVALEQRGAEALQELPVGLGDLPMSTVPLRPFNLVGVEYIRRFLDWSGETDLADPEVAPSTPALPAVPSLSHLVDELATGERGLIMVMGKGGVGKTTIAAAIAVELAHRGFPVHLTTTDPSAHVASTIAGEIPHLRVSRIDPAAETEAYTNRVLATRGRGLSPDELDLLREDLKSPCTEEVAVFHAFSRAIGQGRSEFVVVDTAPTGHTVLLLDTTGAYHQEIMRSMTSRADVGAAVTPLMRLRDPSFTRMVLVTLPETTPVLEAAQLQDDLRRAQIEPFAWVVNSSLAATGTRDPLLIQRAKAEIEQIDRIRDRLASRTFLVPWLPEEPVGEVRLRHLAEGGAHAAAPLAG